MALVIYLLMAWGVITSSEEATQQVILENQERLEENDIIIDDLMEL